ncbi:MAG TPA: hypothetical protein VF121_08365 [Thermoanaerobaculia bacterium]|nr:hypothetical protein [Thermoanaerobaculia bacterium]
MSITIVRNLDVVQESAKLPMRVDLSQTLSSSENKEQVTIEYALNEDNDIWFDGSPKTKTVSRTETIARAETPIRHRLSLVHGDGEEVERAKIAQTITDELGIETPDQAFLTIVR